jgi:hypothetical protein
MSRWIVTDTKGDFGAADCVVVEAPSADAAADIGIRELQDGYDSRLSDGHQIEWIYVASFEPTAYQRDLRAKRAELQCCGGGPAYEYIGCAGHLATCDLRPEGTGQRARANEDAA